MFDYELATNRLSKYLTPFRLNHSISTMNMCAKLSKKYNVDLEEAKIAGLLHDCAKDIPLSKALLLCKKFNLELDKYYHQNPDLAHGILGAYLAEHLFKLDPVTHKNILEAIHCHATGKPNMNNLSKILFLSDYTEVGRVAEWADIIRTAEQISLDYGVLESYNHFLRTLIKNNQVIHPSTMEGRNDILKNFHQL